MAGVPRFAQKRTRVHAASLGEYAPDAAVRAGRAQGAREVALVDELGRRESYGRLVQRRRVGGYLVQLADDTGRGMWWVVAVRVDPPRQVLAGPLSREALGRDTPVRRRHRRGTRPEWRRAAAGAATTMRRRGSVVRERTPVTTSS